jgi:hypothetical protein
MKLVTLEKATQDSYDTQTLIIKETTYLNSIEFNLVF